MDAMVLNRALEARFNRKLRPGKVALLLGPRRSGKTWFLKSWIARQTEPVLLMNGEDLNVVRALAERTVENYRRILGNHKILVVDEAQKVPEIGLALKLMVDEIEGLSIIATGSSAFDLSNSMGEPLTGRLVMMRMFPLSMPEYAGKMNAIEIQSSLEERLVFGSYPELLQYPGNNDKSDYLRDLVSTYLLKDVLQYEGVRHAGKIFDLLRLVAFQVGGEVSMEELGRNLQISKNTVEKYLDLLTSVFVLFRLQGYSGNLRKEISKKSKWYFVDNGVRNALVANLNPLKMRNDAGLLWENFLLSERLKYQSYTGMVVNNYFWRTYDGQEIDWVEERGGNLYAYEAKFNSAAKEKIPPAWAKHYPDSKYKLLTPGNYHGFVGLV